MLTGRVALVTGGSGLIGRKIAQTLAGAGADVAIQYGSNRPDTPFFPIQADLDKPGFETRLLAAVQNRFGAADILVNCAADQALTPFAEIDAGAINRMLQINLTAIITLTRAFVAQIPATGGVVTNISSIEAQQPAAGHGHYSASKAALDSLTRTFATDYGPKGIRCNGIAPGLIRRDGIEDAWPDGVARWKSACPLTRMGTPADIANAVLFLSSPDAGWINGATLTIDGGTTARGGW
jgi:NAD(P)-dependent dehydrogenase (short-subunit alcohol dehydrogenase family)